MNKVKATIIGTSILAVIGGIATFYIPESGGDLTGLRYHIFLCYPWMFTVLYLGASATFLMGLAHFRTKAKVAYSFLCLGLIIMVLAQSQLGIITYLNAWLGAWVHYGFIMIPYLFGGFFVFIGIRLFSRLLKIKYVWNSWLFTIPIVAVGIVIAIIFPHPPGNLGFPEYVFDMALSLMVWNALFSTFATIVTLKVKQTITPVFQKAMGWTFIALVIHTFAAWQIAAFQVIGFEHWYNEYGFVILPFIIAGAIFLKAGYEFNKASEY